MNLQKYIENRFYDKIFGRVKNIYLKIGNV